MRFVYPVLLFMVTALASANDFLPVNDANYEAAVRFLDSTNISAGMEQLSDQMLTMEMEKNPAMMPYREVFRKFFEKHLSYSSIKVEFATLYAQTFTTDELDRLTAFYATPVGKKAMQAMPMLFQKGMEIGMARVQNNLPELQSMIEQEAKRIQKLQQEPALEQIDTKKLPPKKTPVQKKIPVGAEPS